jgi:glycosyltransferase involved in cell wall biosynthesis
MKTVEVILRTCDSAVVHTDWRVRYVDMPKAELVRGCVTSLVNACKKVDTVRLVVYDDHSSEETVTFLKDLLANSGLDYEFNQLGDKGYNNSSLIQYTRCRDSQYDLVYSIEDDYLHEPNSIVEMIESYELFEERIKGKEIVIYPFDEPSEYNPPNRQDFIVHGSHRHWRTGIFTTQVLLATPKLFKDYWDIFELIAKKYNGDYLKPRAEHYEEGNTIWKIWNNGPAVRFSPIPSLALHMQFEQQKDPFIDWKNWWNDYTK